MKFLIKTVIPVLLVGIFVPEFIFLIFYTIGIFLIGKYFCDKNKIYEIIFGTVTEIREIKRRSTGSNYKNTCYAPIFEYTYDGQSYMIQHPVYTGIPDSYSIGQKVELKIYPDTPNQAILNSYFSVNMLLYGGLGFIIIPGIIMWMFIKGGIINFYSLGEKIQSVVVYCINLF